MTWWTIAALAAPFAEEICVEGLSQSPGLAPITDARPLLERRDLDAYRQARQFLDIQRLPPPTLMRPEAFVAYFRSDYPAPAADDTPIHVQVDLVQHPVLSDHRLLRVGVQARRDAPSVYETAQITMLVDVSPSMRSVFSRRFPVLPSEPGADGLYPPVTRLDLAQHALRGFAGAVEREGTIALATYAGAADVVLPPTSLEAADALHAAVDRLAIGDDSWGSGLEDAYTLASEMYVPCADNRLVLLTDYNAHLDRDLQATLTRVAQLGRGMEVSAVGLGLGERAAGQLEQLAEIGLGNTWYADTAYELELAFAREFGSRATVARDVTLALDTDAAVVGRRTIGWRGSNWRAVGNLPSGFQRTVFVDLKVTGPTAPAVSWTAGSAIPGRFVAEGRTTADAAVPWDEAPADLRLTYAAAMFAAWLAGDLTEAWTLPQLEAIAAAAVRPGHPEDAELAALIRQARRIDDMVLDRHHRR